MRDSRFHLLVIDDDPLVLDSIKLTLPNNWQMLGRGPQLEGVHGRHFDAAFIDLHLTENKQQPKGLEIMRRLSQLHPHMEIVAISGDLDRNLMEECLRHGASRFLAKPLSAEEIQLVLNKIEAWLLLQGARERSLKRNISWIGSSPQSREVQRKIASMRGETSPILIEGESGTGKEVTAALLNVQEDGRHIISVNVAAIPENLFESEFFGHMKGAFTGADQNKMGLAEAAHGGDLFLDEIEALPLHLQPKLLRFLETGEVRRIGAKDSIQVKTRVIAATNRNLETLVKEGKFREDLLWRISGQKILLPPLRQRKEDIAELVEFFFKQDKVRQKTLADDALEYLKEYPWPGNVRELKRVCEQLVLVSPLPIIRSADVKQIVQPKVEIDNIANLDLSQGLNEILGQFEAQLIKRALALYNGDVDEAARYLKVSRSNLYKKIKDYSLDGSNN